MNINYSIGLEYVPVDNNCVFVSGVGSCKDVIIIIPEILPDGRTVTGIADKAFYKCEHIRELVLSSGVKYLGNYAFAWCVNLKKINLLSVCDIQNRCFIGCSSLSKIYLSNSLLSVGQKAFAYCTAIERFVFPEDTTSFGDAIFEGCRNLLYVSLPRDMKIINNAMFCDCLNLTCVDIGPVLEYIDEFAFSNCVSLKTFNINKATIINQYAFHGCYNQNMCFVS